MCVFQLETWRGRRRRSSNHVRVCLAIRPLSLSLHSSASDSPPLPNRPEEVEETENWSVCVLLIAKNLPSSLSLWPVAVLCVGLFVLFSLFPLQYMCQNIENDRLPSLLLMTQTSRQSKAGGDSSFALDPALDDNYNSPDAAGAGQLTHL